MCTKLAKIFGMIFGSIAGILAILGVIGFIVWTYKEGSFMGVSNFWNYLYTHFHRFLFNEMIYQKRDV